ncbi:hypothetical protein FRB90_007781, partial [Tulasnella sp. 427]
MSSSDLGRAASTLAREQVEPTARSHGAVSSLKQKARARIQAIDALQGKRSSPFDFTSPARAPQHVVWEPLKSRLVWRDEPLVDNFSRKHDYLRISLTERCNLRCFYCMPEEGIDLSPGTDILTDDEVIRLATLFVRHGVRKIRLTGGEPTIRKDILDIVRRLNSLRSLGLESIGMTSNGLALHRKLPELVKNGLTHLNLSLDTLNPVKFEAVTRRRGHEAVMRSLDTALSLLSPSSKGVGLRRVKLNVVVVKGVNDDEVMAFLELTRHQDLSVRFIEFMPFSGNNWGKDRLVCLFDGAEISLRDRIREGASDDDLTRLIGFAVGQKKEKHEEMGQIDTATNRPMILIGPKSKSVARPRPSRTGRLLALHYRLSTEDTTRLLRTYSSVPFKPAATPTQSDSPPKLTHVDAHGNPSMVNVSDKTVTKRSATAVGRIHLTPEAFTLVYPPSEYITLARASLTTEQQKAASKGPVLTTAQLAG